jgi:hypothetical protein
MPRKRAQDQSVVASGSQVPRHRVRAGLLEPQSPRMEVHILWQNASAPEPSGTQDKVAVLGILAGGMGTTEVSGR